MDIQQLKYVAAVAEYRNLSRAAEALFVSQPALTKALNSLEGSLNVKLFNRNVKPITLTYAGERFLAHAQGILNISDVLEKEMNEIAGNQRGTITLGLPTERAASWLPFILPEYHKRYPLVDIRIAEGSSKTLEDGMLKGQIDFSIYTLPVSSENLEYETLCDDPILLGVPRSHPFAQEIDLSQNSPKTPHYLAPERLNNEKFITLMPHQGLYRTAMQIFEMYSIHPQIVLQVQSNSTAVRLMSAGEGMTFTSLNSLLRERMLEKPACFTICDPIFSRKVVIAHRKGDCLSIHAKKLLDTIRYLIQNQPMLEAYTSLAPLNQNIRYE